MIELAWLAVWESSCSRGCRNLDGCDIGRRLARGEHVEAWKARPDGTLWCSARSAPTYLEARVDDDRHVVGWTERPVEDWGGRRRRELHQQLDAARVELIRHRGGVPPAPASTLPPPEVTARAATRAEVAECGPAEKFLDGCPAGAEVLYARGWARGKGRKDVDDGGLGDAAKGSKAAPEPVFVRVESLLVRGRVGGRRFARQWSRRDSGKRQWSAAGAMLDGGRVDAAEVGRAIKDGASG